MIRCNLARIMGEHKARIADFARKTAQKVDLNAVEQICLLFDRTVGELLELVPNQHDQGAA
ncbi:helix-turn-helix transcriptional regulator [Cellvibrio sp. BR]|uniref:helix-turn-helix domain-containing protein n=1 Tax=Cellvibrio sp. BR TaxID=1134474 RepID=UPI00058AD2AF|nr:helix-turn-helix transcriptional regulator [Cellvibrio sp. BR]